MPSMNTEIAQKNGREYWRSLEEYAQTHEFAQMVQREFPSVAPEALNDATRRDFLKVMGASLAMAGMTGCSWPEERILPFTNRPEGRLPGVPVYYATVMELGGVARGLLVKSFDGRPIKVEGNPQHPESQGASDVLSQASVLDLYDPDRQQAIEERQSGATYPRTWTDFDASLRPVMESHRAAGGRGLAVLAETSSSPSLARMRARLLSELPNARWAEWEPVSHDVVREATQSMFGRPMRLHPAFDQADVILSLDHDFLVSDPVSVRYAFDWAQGRQIRNDQMSRLYVAESLFSPTGGVADHRLAIPASDIPGFAAEVAAALLGAGVTSPALDASASLRTAAQSGKNAAFAKQAAADLAAHRGHCLVVAGPRQPVAVHVLALALNEALGNIGTTLQITNDPDPDRPTHAAAIRDLTASLGNGEIETLVILGGNPVYNAPADLAFADRMGRAGRTIHLTLHPNETSSRCSWVLPRAHYLECWGDARAHEGTISVAQPLIRPLYDGRSALEMVATLLGDRHSGYELVRETHAELGAAGEGFERAWRDILHEGLIPGTSLPAEAVAFDPSRAAEAIRALSPAASTDLEVVFAPDPCTYDGRFANNGWLQELPDTVTKVTWDNIAQIAPSTAAQLDLATGDMIRIEKDGRAIEVPAWITPGHAPRSITLSMGYGRTVSGHVGTGVGFDVYPLRASTAPHVQSGVSVSKTGRSYVFATTQDHFPINSKGEEGVQTRLHQLVREASLAEVVGSTAGAHGARSSHGAEAGHEAGTHAAEAGHGAASAHGAEHPPVMPLWDEHEYEGNKWGMAIDLTACTGCNSCVVACQSENNIPVVGRDQVRRGREMHWIRIDRYFSGTPDDPQLVLQPVTCHHCENAPCEQVCPVAATTHSREGLNDMTYNRCIGTRYCSNNCPYKVRRFNFYAYNHELGMTERMVKNPDVTVRARGVMEKCTFCIQRIAAVRITSKNEKRPIRDGEITPACAQACPTRAIVFGDLNDPNSRVRRMHDDSRAYGMLDFELYTKPRLHYLTRVRNPHPALASSVGEGSGEEHHG